MSATKLHALAWLTILAVAATAEGGFIGLVIEEYVDPVPQDAGLAVVRISAAFDDPLDRLLGIGYSVLETSAPGGFYRHPFATGPTAPSSSLFEDHPLLEFTTFVTIGLLAVPDGVIDGTTIDPDYDDADPSTILGGWFNDDPVNGQGLAGNYPDAGDHRIPISQLTMAAGSESALDLVTGKLTVFWQDASGALHLDREVVPAPAAWVMLVVAVGAGARRRRTT